VTSAGPYANYLNLIPYNNHASTLLLIYRLDALPDTKAALKA